MNVTWNSQHNIVKNYARIYEKKFHPGITKVVCLFLILVLARNGWSELMIYRRKRW